ncbi:hypothetical protein V2O64_17940 [Verrucomicrobiaceae bacterium 227]
MKFRSVGRTLYSLGMEDGDVERVQQLRGDPEMHSALPTLLRYMDPNGLSGSSGDVVAEVIAGAGDPRHAEKIIKGMWGGHLSKKLENTILQMSRSDDRELRHASLYYGLSPVSSKSREVTERLLEYLSDSDLSTFRRAQWGLGHGVQAEDGSFVAERALKLIRLRNPGGQQEGLVKLLSQASPSNLPVLRAALDEGDLSEKVRATLEKLEQSLSNQ